MFTSWIEFLVQIKLEFKATHDLSLQGHVNESWRNLNRPLLRKKRRGGKSSYLNKFNW